MLVYEYLPNGSVCGHLYDNGKGSTTRLEFKQRLSIAIGAAKGRKTARFALFLGYWVE
jgi:hypothetical protein